MRYEHVDYTSSSTKALAKEAVALRKSYDDVYDCLGKIEADKSIIGKLDAVYGYLLETHNIVISVLFDRFVDKYNIRQYYNEHPNEDWLDNDRFMSWYEAIAAELTASERLNAVTSQVEYWAENLNESTDE